MAHSPSDAISDVLSRDVLASALGRPVASVSWERIGAERGFAGVVLRLVVEATDGAPRESVVAKVGAGPADDALAREVAFYRHVAAVADAPAPRCRWAGVTDDGTLLLLLDDVTGARVGDQLAGASSDDVAAVLDAMAPMWRRGATVTDVARDVPPLWRPDDAAIATRVERYRAQWDALRDSLSARLPGEVTRIGERLRAALADVIAGLCAAPAALTHGDLHLDNVLFPDDGGAVVLDWATATRGPVALDALPFVAMSLTPDDQRRSSSALVETLLDALCPDDVAGRERFVDDGRRALLRYFAGVVGWLSRPPSGVAREAALREAAVDDGRLAHALLHWDVERVLPPA